MKSVLVEELGLSMQPVGISFAEEKPEDAFEFGSDKRVCVMSMMQACAKGKIVAVSDETCTCPGGAVGMCFGDAFTRRNHRIVELLSTGMQGKEGEFIPPMLQHGERFFATPELAKRWIDSVPYTEAPGKYRILMPFADWDEDNPPELVYLFANPDQLSVLVTMCGFFRGTGSNVVSPFGAACHSILYAYQEIGKQEPKAIMGGFDISQRDKWPKELLTLTMPYGMFLELERGVAEGCLTTESWRNIANRYQ